MFALSCIIGILLGALFIFLALPDEKGKGVKMSTYFYGACHDCKVFIEASNVDLEHAEKLTKMWAEKFGHEGHNIQATNEHDDEFDELVRHGRMIVSRGWFGSYQTEPHCEPYTDVSEQVEKLFE